nr:protein LAZY 1-like [Tanacetum cinerariifolium]
MKLLDWMQHKFRQANNEHLTEIAPRNSCAYLTGQPSHDDLQYYPKSHYHAKAPNTTQTGRQFRKSFACIESARADNKQTEEESAAAFSGLFHGFLAIGTLATETVTNEPAAPTFATSEKRFVLPLNAPQLIKNHAKKVHPECVPVAPESDNHLNEENKSSNQDEMLSEYITLYPTTGILKSSANCTKSHTPHPSCRMNDSDRNRECWIKSDDEFLVLEL